MRTTIYLVRHAEAQSNTNIHHIGEAYLTEEGVVQAERLAKYLSTKSILNIYSSKILRARLTAQEISKTVDKVPIELGFLKERNGTYSSDSIFTPEETFSDMLVRVREAKSFLESLPEGSVAVVSHAIFIKSLLAHIMMPWVESEKMMSEIEDTLVIDHATISQLVFNKEKKRWRIMSLNCSV